VFSFLRSIHARFTSLGAWWTRSGQRFVSTQWRRLVAGCGLGCLGAILTHLIWRDKVFLPTLQKKWRASSAQAMFDGTSEYKSELYALGMVFGAAAVVWVVPRIWRYLRAWWAGIASLTGMFALLLTVRALWPGPLYSKSAYSLTLLFLVLLACELWRFERSLTLKALPLPPIPPPNRPPSVEREWQVSTGDDPIQEWEEDIIGRTSVIEVLAEHIFVRRSPIVALHGGLGDGKSSVLNLLRRSLKGRAIIIPFSAWLPGSDETLAIDLFRDIATECKRVLYIPQIRKQSVAYARTISGSVSYLATLKEILPAQSQREEIEEIRETLARVPLPIVVLLDEVDRMQREEILVLLKILRGASSIPNVTFICAFSQEEMKKHLSPNGALTYGYLEKFFPVSVSLAAPDPAMVGRLLQDRVKSAASNGGWFLGTDQKKFDELLEFLWHHSLSHICTNLRKASLLFNDVSACARSIGGEVNILDLIAIEALRRFAPEVYGLVRRNSVFLTYGSGSLTSGQYMSDRRKEKESSESFAKLTAQVDAAPEPRAVKNILDFLFPNFSRGKEGLSILSLARSSNEDLAEKEKRICSPDYFSVYFRSAIPEDMYSEAELTLTIANLNRARNEEACEQVLKEALTAIPKNHPKREDFLWKLGRIVQVRLNNSAAEWLAYAAASRATDYAYDVMNIGEAARALNIVFEAAQKLSSSSKAQEILVGAMKRAADDTFAKRLLEFTERKVRNQILLNVDHIDPKKVKLAFVERMRRRYGRDVDADKVDIATGDWWAFRTWADNSEEDRKEVADFWRRYIGASRKRLAQAINVLYPKGSWSEDPRPFISTVFPFDELRGLVETLNDGQQLDEVEANAMLRFGELLEGKWFNIAQPDR
jgi:KAP family P-loop domain